MTDNPLLPQDRQLLGRLAAGNDWLRSVLCTLARHGTQLRQDNAERAAEVIAALSPWPWFKAGQFLFDLMEWEDFMVDGPPPPALATVLQPENWQRLENLLAALRALVDAAQPEPEPSVPLTPTLPTSVEAMVSRFRRDDDLPPLAPGLHLYRDVVLGIWSTATLPPPVEPPG